jgi:hypothetical protein
LLLDLLIGHRGAVERRLYVLGEVGPLVAEVQLLRQRNLAQDGQGVADDGSRGGSDGSAIGQADTDHGVAYAGNQLVLGSVGVGDHYAQVRSLGDTECERERGL